MAKLGLCENKDVHQHGSGGSLGATKKLMITYRTVRCHVTEALYLNARRHENFEPCMTGVHKFSRNPGTIYNILAPEWVTSSNSNTWELQILGPTGQSSVATTSWFSEFVHPCCMVTLCQSRISYRAVVSAAVNT